MQTTSRTQLPGETGAAGALVAGAGVAGWTGDCAGTWAGCAGTAPAGSVLFGAALAGGASGPAGGGGGQARHREPERERARGHRERRPRAPQQALAPARRRLDDDTRSE